MSSKPERYVQCTLERKLSPSGGKHVTHAWIAERGAKLTTKVELILDNGTTQLWEVVSVGNSLPREVLKEAQDQRRKPPPSIRDTAKDKRQQAAL